MAGCEATVHTPEGTVGVWSCRNFLAVSVVLPHTLTPGFSAQCTQLVFYTANSGSLRNSILATPEVVGAELGPGSG